MINGRKEGNTHLLNHPALIQSLILQRVILTQSLIQTLQVLVTRGAVRRGQKRGTGNRIRTNAEVRLPEGQSGSQNGMLLYVALNCL